MIGPETQIYISVSARPGNFGATVYNSLFQKYGINAVYLPREAPESATHLIEAIRLLKIKGCSVSMPLKSKVIPFLDELDFGAKESGSVNTILNENGYLKGFNSDAVGLLECLRLIEPRSVLIYGAGAVVGSFLCALKKLNTAKVRIIARNPAAAKEIVQHWKAHLPKTNLEVLETWEKPNLKFDLFANLTPASLEGPSHEVYRGLELAPSLFDCVVAPEPTPLILEAKKRHLKIVTGVDFCRQQVQSQFFYYTNRMPTLEEIDVALEGFFSIQRNIKK